MAAVPYDRLILSPGIDFVDGSVPGWDLSTQNTDAACLQGRQPDRTAEGPDRWQCRRAASFGMIAPPNPYRCPPGPYERMSMVAHLLKASNPTAKILIVDPKEKFSKQALFEEGWNKHYSGMIDRIGPDFGGGNVEVRPDTMEVVVDGEVEKVDVCNVIPAMKAGRIAELAGVTDRSGFAPIVPATMQSRIDENIHVLGDSSIAGRHAEIGLFGEQPGQGLRQRGARRADRGPGVPGQVLEHLLVADRHR